jgi:hypothetical protein
MPAGHVDLLRHEVSYRAQHCILANHPQGQAAVGKFCRLTLHHLMSFFEVSRATAKRDGDLRGLLLVNGQP